MGQTIKNMCKYLITHKMHLSYFVSLNSMTDKPDGEALQWTLVEQRNCLPVLVFDDFSIKYLLFSDSVDYERFATYKVPAQIV